ncbi:MAG: hypothetical protein ACXVNM_13585 [Bacteroidia bacterium]
MINTNDSPFKQLQSVLADFSAEGKQTKLELLKNCSLERLSSAKTIREYHDTLLFILSYAEGQDIYFFAEKEMRRISGAIAMKQAINDQVTGSGITGTTTEGAYSLTLIQWLIKEFPGTVSLHSFDDTGIHPKEILKHGLPEAEFELISDEKLNQLRWLEKASGTKNKVKLLVWLVDVMNAINTSPILKDQLFESMKLFVSITPLEDSFSRSFGKVKIAKQFFHTDGIIKKFSEEELINKKLPPEKKLNDKEKKGIIKASRIALCLLNRETDPITYSEELQLKYYELERGLSIGLFSIDAERRLPLDSYIGFMMFKNGYPMSYGGAWLFGKRSLIGINIFESFRGGESAIVFAQLLRCYHMAFGATYFEVEPYQFGKNNPEGIQSGAFWFYFRFGFRPVDKSLHGLSLQEFKKISETKGYRSPAEILKQFTKSNLFVHLSDDRSIPIDPADLSKFITHQINKQFAGNRSAALKWAVQLLKREGIIEKSNSIAGNKLSLFFALCLDLKKLGKRERTYLSKLISAKESSEFEYIHLLNDLGIQNYLSEPLEQFLL